MPDVIQIAFEAVDKGLEKKFSDLEKDMNRFETGVKNVNEKLDSVGTTTDKAKKGFSGMQAAIVTANQGIDLLGKGLSIAKEIIDQTVGKTLEYSKQVRDLSTNLGISAEETSKIIQASDDYGISVEAVTSALQMAVKKGFAPNIETLAKLADEYNNISDPTERAARLTEVFGRNWTSLTPMLKEGGQAIRDAAKEAEKLGLVLSDKDVQAARALEVQVDNLNDHVDALKLKIGKGLIPELSHAAEGTVNFISVLDGTASSAEKTEWQIGFLNRTFGEGAPIIANTIKQLEDYQKGLDATAMTAGEKAVRANMAHISSLTMVQTSLSDLERGIRNQAEVYGVLDAAMANNSTSHAALAAAQNATIAAENAAIAAEAAHRSSLADSISSVDKLAQSLKDATTAQAIQTIAQGQLDVLKKSFETGKIGAEDFKKAADAVLLTYGLATPKSIAMAEAQDKINQAFLAGQLPLDKYIASTGLIPKIAADGKVTLQELTSLGIVPTTSAARDQTTAVDNLTSAWGRVPQNVKTVYTIETKGTAPSGSSGGTTGGSSGRGYAAGANFVVPAGYANDTYPLRVSSGEHVQVTPAGQSKSIPAITITQSFSGAQAEPEKYKAIMYEVITDVIEQAMRQ